MAKNKETISEYEHRILVLDAKLLEANDGLKAGHQSNVDFASRVFMLVQIIMELGFEGCIAWIWYFYYRSYVEKVKITKEAIAVAEVTTSPASQPVQSQSASLITLQQEPAPSPILNGQTPHSGMSHSRPIGFHNPILEEVAEEQGFPPVQTRTGLYSEQTIVDDRYTVLHTYQRGGRIYHTPYTENQILSRIGQYERELVEAEQKKLGEEVLENRRQWHQYWNGKLEELRAKQ